MAQHRISIARRRALVARWETSGQSIQAFAADHGMAYSTFYRWSRKYRQAQQQRRDKPARAEIQMVEVQVVDAPSITPPPSPPSLELNLPGGSPLRFQQGVDPIYIAALIVAVGDVVRC